MVILGLNKMSFSLSNCEQKLSIARSANKVGAQVILYHLHRRHIHYNYNNTA